MPDQAGLSLIELMISMTIGVILLIGITSLIVSQSSNRDELEKSSRQIENGRYATQIMRDDIQLAGYYGNTFSLSAPPAALPDPCLTGPIIGSPSLFEAMPVHIQGYNSPAASPITACLPAANFLPGTDILVVRRADSLTTPLDTTGQVFLQASAASSIMATGNGSTAANFPLTFDQQGSQQGNVLVPLRKYLVHIYFISPCSTMANGATCQASDDGGRPIPTLKMLELSFNGGATAWKLTPLVEGIENLQFDYGVDADGDGYPDSYITAPATTTDWSNVMAVRINLLARNLECSTGYTDTKTYNLGLTTNIQPSSAVACTNGGFKRHVFTELVRAVNPSGRRATQ